MKRHIMPALIIAVLAMRGLSLGATHPLKPDAVGGSFIGTRQDANQIGGSGFGPGFSVVFRYDLSPRVMLDLNAGYSSAMDDILSTEFAEAVLFPTATVKAYFKLLKEARMSPFLHAGATASRVSFQKNKPDYPLVDAVYTNICYLVGTGIDYQSIFNFNITLSADFRNTMYSGFKQKPKYWVFEAGFTIPMRPPVREPEFDYNILNPESDNLVAGEDATAERAFNSGDEFAVFIHKVETLLDRIQDKHQLLDDLEARVIANERAIATVTGFVASEFVNITNVDNQPELPRPTDDESFMNLYQNALASLNNKHYTEAIQQFEQLLIMNRNHALASNCQYWIGEGYYAQANYSKAADAFNQVLNFKLSSKLDDALLMSGICQLELGNRQKAREYFNELIDEYPDSEFVTRATTYLNSL
jgi:tol-pal system protein YbgF